MNAEAIIGLVNLLGAGILAGEEFTIRYGLRAPLASLDQYAHIQLRQALIRRLRILVPAIFGLAIVSGAATTIVNGFDQGFAFRCAGLLGLATFIGITLTGTVPINQAALDWDPVAPPSNWQTMVHTWERLDTVRCWAAMTAFVLFLIALTVR